MIFNFRKTKQILKRKSKVKTKIRYSINFNKKHLLPH
jgi:hypothetical protein